MKVRLIGSSPDAPRDRHYASSYLINDRVAIDAGTLGFSGTPEEQAEVRHVFLTHSHMDHISSLPVFLENAYDPAVPAVTVHALPETMDTLQRHIFNGEIWPDFIHLSPPGRPFFLPNCVDLGLPIEVEGLTVVPVAMNHIVPTAGYLVTDGRSTVAFGADSGPTDRIWELLKDMPAPRSVFLECTFPDELTGLAGISAHLTPESFGLEVAKMPAATNILAVHLKHRFRDKVAEELLALGLPSLRITGGEATYEL
ncbi:3',5'-cyclic-nucleotide phosphodiesterase [Paludibaculum fermentans]|uniref:3',5'-cyclic-nucleotide phosphodiesterase n=1 Tax=Paludibaculum fermentans TaxID=1473598 RepID=UPI003EB6F141